MKGNYSILTKYVLCLKGTYAYLFCLMHDRNVLLL